MDRVLVVGCDTRESHRERECIRLATRDGLLADDARAEEERSRRVRELQLDDDRSARRQVLDEGKGRAPSDRRAR